MTQTSVLYRRAAAEIDPILKGMKPSEIPSEQVRAAHQPQGREGAPHHGAAVVARLRRRGDRMTASDNCTAAILLRRRITRPSEILGAPMPVLDAFSRWNIPSARQERASPLVSHPSGAPALRISI